jgi:putative phage-type endonuclease
VTAVELLPPAEATPDNPQWHKLRRAGVTASEIAAVLGISPWESPFSLYWHKEEGWEVESNPEMNAGHRAEPVIADWFADECDPLENLVICRAGLYAHPDRPWQLATPDRLLCDPQMHDDPFPGELDWTWPHPNENIWTLLECKYLIGGWDGWGEPGTDDVPVHYRAQCLWQLDVLGVDEVYLAAWHGAEFRTYVVRRDEKDLRVMRTAGAAFMDRLAAGDPPPLDGHTATVRTLKALHPSIEDREQEISPATAEGYRRARALKARASAMADVFEARLRAEMGPARRAVSDGRFLASRSIYERAGYTVGVATIDKLNPARSKK